MPWRTCSTCQPAHKNTINLVLLKTSVVCPLLRFVASKKDSPALLWLHSRLEGFPRVYVVVCRFSLSVGFELWSENRKNPPVGENSSRKMFGQWPLLFSKYFWNDSKKFRRFLNEMKVQQNERKTRSTKNRKEIYFCIRWFIFKIRCDELNVVVESGRVVLELL